MVTRYDLDGRCDPVEGGSWVDYEDHQAEVAQLQARVAELEAETLELKRHASELSKQWCATAMHDAKVGEREKKRIAELEGVLSTFVNDAVEDDVKGDTLVLSSPESLKLARKVLGQ